MRAFRFLVFLGTVLLFSCLAPALVAAASSSKSPSTSNPPASAEPTEPAESTEYFSEALSPLVVTASALPDDLSRIPANVQVVTEKEIEKTGSTNLVQLLERTTSVRVEQQPGNFVGLRLRGFQSAKNMGSTLSDHVLVLIDGNRSGTGNVNSIPMDNIERVEVLRGPASVLYGGSAVGGVVNVITKRGKGDVSGKIGAEAGSFGNMSMRAGLQGEIVKDTVGFSVAGQLDKLGEYRPGDTDRNYENTEMHTGGVGASLTLHPSDSTSFAAVVNYKSIFDTGSAGGEPILTPNDQVKNDYLYGSLEMLSELAEDVTLKASVYGNTTRYSFTDNGQWIPGTTVYTTTMLGARSVLGVPLPSVQDFSLGRMSIGLEYARQDLELTQDNIWMPNVASDTYSAFLEHKIDLGPVTLQNAARYDLYDMRAKDNDSTSIGDSKSSFDFSQFTWSSGLKWRMTDWLYTRTSLGTAYTPPSPLNLVGDYMAGGYRYVGDPNLKAEESLTWDIGVGVEKGGFSGDIGFFHTRFKNRIVSEYVGFEYVPLNKDKQILAGIEGNLQYTHSFVAKNNFVYTLAPYFTWEYFTERRNKDDGETTTIFNAPEFTALGGIGFGFEKPSGAKVWWDVNAQVVGDRVSKVPTFPATEKYERAYVLYNTRLTLTPVEDLDVYLDMRNITDKYYEYNYGYPMPGRTVAVGFTYAF